jgi:hypothetical protein
VNYSKIYNIDFRAFCILLTPPFLRKNTLIDFLETLLRPLEEINFSFKSFRSRSIYKVTHNGQVVSIQQVLNDYLDKEFKRITIADSAENITAYLYQEAENKPVFIYSEAENNPVYIFSESDLTDLDFDFVVNIPLEIKPINEIDYNTLELQIKSLINYYKLSSKRYRILWI